MKVFLSRITVVLLAALLTLQLLTPMQVKAAYENTHANTGNQRKDIVAVALTQLGYMEGTNNSTKYGNWYGMPNQPWCAMFISWCANQAGISTGIIQKNARAHPTYFGLSAKSGSSYRPRAGDLFFCKRGGSYAHAGIVHYVDGNYFYTIEGNANSGGSYNGIGVFSLKRKISACYFASPSYLGNADCTYVQGYDSTHPHNSYYKCSDCGDRYYAEGCGTLADCQTCIMENCEHSFGPWNQVDNDHSRSCEKCTWTQTEEHNWSITILQKADCSQAGSQEKTCESCGAFRSETVPQSAKHSFSGWKQVDQTDHSRVCSVCQMNQVSSHTFPKQWTGDQTGHYKQCSGCGLKDQTTAHDFSENCEAGCSVCGYVGESRHSFDAHWETDEQNHWHKCNNCQQLSEPLPHSFDNSCDTQCKDCGYIRQTSHNFTEQWFYDEGWHWTECAVCGYVKDHEKHTGDSSLQDVNCQQCGYVIVHVHVYDTIQNNKDTHWGVCACSAVQETTAHQWEQSRICPVCQAQKPANIWFWILWIGIPLLVLSGVSAFLLIRSRKKTGLYQ